MQNLKRSLEFRKSDIDFEYEIQRQTGTSPRYSKISDGHWVKINSDRSESAVLICGGDLMCEPGMSRACFFDGDYDFRPCFRFFRDVLKGSDLVLANLETIVSERFPYAHEKHRVNHHTGLRYHCNAPTQYLDALRYAGFDGFALANNHNADGGVLGVADTLENVDRRGFLRTGMFYDETDPRVLLIDVNGIRIALLSYTEHINRNLDRELFTEEGCRVMLNRYSPERAAADIHSAREQGAEFVLVYLHFLGEEYSNTVWNRQRQTARALAEAGADCVMRSHMHAIQEYDRISTRDGRCVPVIYSLGNLITSDATKNGIARRSVLYKVRLKKSGQGVQIASEAYIPLKVMEGSRSCSFAIFPTQTQYRTASCAACLGRAQERIQQEIGCKIRLDNGEK